jgi:ribonuclease-3
LSTFADFTCVVEQINQIVSRIASNTNLAQRGFELGLDRCICKNPSQGNFVSDKLMATTVEAIAGAVFLETSWDRAALQRIVDALGLAWPDS